MSRTIEIYCGGSMEPDKIKDYCSRQDGCSKCMFKKHARCLLYPIPCCWPISDAERKRDKNGSTLESEQLISNTLAIRRYCKQELTYDMCLTCIFYIDSECAISHKPPRQWAI